MALPGSGLGTPQFAVGDAEIHRRPPGEQHEQGRAPPMISQRRRERAGRRPFREEELLPRLPVRRLRTEVPASSCTLMTVECSDGRERRLPPTRAPSDRVDLPGGGGQLSQAGDRPGSLDLDAEGPSALPRLTSSVWRNAPIPPSYARHHVGVTNGCEALGPARPHAHRSARNREAIADWAATNPALGGELVHDSQDPSCERFRRRTLLKNHDRA